MDSETRAGTVLFWAIQILVAAGCGVAVLIGTPQGGSSDRRGSAALPAHAATAGSSDANENGGVTRGQAGNGQGHSRRIRTR